SAGGGWLVDESLEMGDPLCPPWGKDSPPAPPPPPRCRVGTKVARPCSPPPPILEQLTARVEPIAWSAGGSCCPRTAARANDMLRQAVDLLARAKAEGGNRLYVPS